MEPRGLKGRGKRTEIAKRAERAEGQSQEGQSKAKVVVRTG